MFGHLFCDHRYFAHTYNVKSSVMSVPVSGSALAPTALDAGPSDQHHWQLTAHPASELEPRLPRLGPPVPTTNRASVMHIQASFESTYVG